MFRENKRPTYIGIMNGDFCRGENRVLKYRLQSPQNFRAMLHIRVADGWFAPRGKDGTVRHFTAGIVLAKMPESDSCAA